MLRRYEELVGEGENHPYTAGRMLRIKAVSMRLLICELSAACFFHRQHLSCKGCHLSVFYHGRKTVQGPGDLLCGLDPCPEAAEF